MDFSRLNSFLNWSVRIGQLFGIPINLHITILFFLLPALSRSGLGFGYSVEYAILIVLSILAHELGHALTAKRYRLTGLSIMLHGFGGFAVSSGIRSPKQSLVITLAGPAVTFVIGVLGLAIGTWGQQRFEPSEAIWMQFYLLHYVGYVNVLLGFLNLVPSLPWDGGNAVQALFSMKISPFKATRAVGHLGLLITPPILLYGLFTNQGFLTLFALVGLITSVATLLQSGGIRFGEFFADRRHQKDLEIVAKRQREKADSYLDNVRSREKERQEKERLREMLESSLDEE